MNQEPVKIRELLNEYYEELNQRNYKDETILRYREVTRKILAWCDANDIEIFDQKSGNQFCDETIGGHLSKSGSTLYYRRTLRVARMLVTLQQNGDFEFRSPRTEYEFYTVIGDIIEEYLSHCSLTRRYSTNTLSERKRVLFRFDNYLYKNNKSIEKMTVDLFEDFLEKCCSKHSRRTYKNILRDVFRYLFDKGILTKDYSSFVLKEPKVSRKKRVPTTYTEKEIKRMIKAIDRSSAKGKRDYLVVLLAAEYGWRASDITTFRLDQIDWDENTISIVQNKTGIPVVFPLLASVGNAIIEYLKHGRPEGSADLIIVNHENAHRGKKLTSPTIHSIVSNAMKSANISNWKIKRHGPHSLRHSLASNLLKRNVSIPIIKTVLGHQSTESTKLYLSVDIEKLRLCSLPIPKITSQYYNI